MIRRRPFRLDLHELAIAALFCGGLFPLVRMVRQVRASWLKIPFGDQWDTPGRQLEAWCRGTLTIGELFSQHNESRKFFPRLLYLALSSAGGWDMRKDIIVVFLEVGVLSVLLWRLLQRTQGSTKLSALITWVVMMFLCFSPVQYDNFLWGIQFEPFFPGIAVVAIGNVNLSNLSLRAKTLINLSLAGIATYTFANGMLLWLLGVPLAEQSILARGHRRIAWYGLYLFSAAVAVCGYFIHYTKPSYHPAFASLRSQALDLAHYVILWVGAYFASDFASPFAVGVIACLFFAAAMGSVAISLVDTGKWRAFYPWLLIGAYALLTGLLTAFGRLGFGVKQALDSRYTVFSLFFYLAIVGAIYALYCTHIRTGARVRRAWFLSLVASLLGLAIFCWIECCAKNLRRFQFQRQDRVRLVRALECMDSIPDNPDLELIFPHADVLRRRARILAEHRILRLPFLTEPLISQLNESPPPTDGSSGSIETCAFDSKHELVIAGWAWLPTRQERADCVIIGSKDGSGKFKPMTVLETGIARPELDERLHTSKINHAGFWRTVNPANLALGDVSIEGWAIDLKNQTAWPLASTLRLHAERP